MPTMKLTLYPDEHEALMELARQKKRDLRAQAAMVIRDHLIKSGHLPNEESDKGDSTISAA